VSYYWRSRCGSVELWRGSFRDVAPQFSKRGCYLGDPPYARDVHRDANRTVGCDGASRIVSLGFDHLDPVTRRALAREIARLTERWALVFSDSESALFWRLSLLAANPIAPDHVHLEEERRLLRLLHDDYDADLNESANGILDYNVRAEWVKLGCTPSMNGNGPAEGTEPITICHRKLTAEQRRAWQRHRRWNAGGKRGVYSHPIERAERSAAVTTPKPAALIYELLLDFTEPGELVYDLTAGSGTLGVAVLRANQASPSLPPRRAILVEVREEACAWAAQRLAAAERGSDAASAQRGQTSILDLISR
jgi:hypothetical protein